MAIDSGYIITPISGKKGTDGQNGKNGTGISVQYSVNGTENWHDTFGNGDIYMRQSTNGGTTWSAAMRIVGEKGDKGDTGTPYWVSQWWVDLSASSFDQNTWYPVVGTNLTPVGVQSLRCTVQLNSGTTPAWSTHPAGFSCEFEVQDQRSGWGSTPATCIRFIDNFAWTQAVEGVADQSPVSYTQMHNSSRPVFYLRGGGRYYIETTYSCSWSIQATSYTDSYETVSPLVNARPAPRGTYVKGADASQIMENLLHDSKMFSQVYGADYPYCLFRSGVITENAFDGFSAITGTGDFIEWSNIRGFKLGERYTLSFWAKGPGTVEVYWYGDYVNGQPAYVTTRIVNCSSSFTENSGYGDGWCHFSFTTEWQFYWVTWELSSTGDNSISKRILFRSTTESGVSVAGCKFERGESATAWVPNVDEYKGATGNDGNYTKRIPLYYVSTSTTAPAAPIARITATEAATATTWTQGKYTSFAAGLYYYTCEQIDNYDSSGTYLSSSWSAVTRDTEYENAGLAKLRAAGKYIGKKSAAFTAYTASSNWDWFLAEKSFTVNGVSVTEGNVYVWNGSTWTKDSDSSHLTAAMNDMIALIDTYTTNSTSVGAFATVFAQTMAAKSAFINSLFAKKILIQTNGIIRGGSRYNDSGAVVDASKNGFWISADGTIKGNLQGDFFDSVIIGTNAGKKLTDNSETGSSKASVLIGTGAGANATTASLNTFVGTGAGSNVNGSMNTYIGHQAGQGSGDSATGTQNVAVGKSAGNSITTGANNTYLGTAAGYYQKTGSNNVVVGDEAYMQSTAASGNVVIGAKAANNATLGDDNIIIGGYAAYASKTWGRENILIGAVDSPRYNNDTVPTETINIGGKLFYVPKFFTGNSGLFPDKAIPAFLFKGALFDISADSSLKYARLYGVVEQSFGESFGYIKYANGLLIQWGIELVNKNTRYNDITYNAYSLPPIVLLSATRSATRWESAGFVGAINITKNGFRASYGEYVEATNIEKYTWLAIGESA